MTTVSIIIPTYNRMEVIKKTLSSIYATIPENIECEILVVNDGSTDDTFEYLEKIKNVYKKMKIFHTQHSGPANARNIGLQNVVGDIILFLGDDIIPSKNLINEHLKFHKLYSQENIAVLGKITWHPEIKITSYMKWLENGGPYFPFYRFKHMSFVKGFISSNISVKRRFVENEYFDKNFPYAIHEDTEYGWRLEKKGLKIIYNENAVAYHYHYVSIEDSWKRAEQSGESAEYFKNKHPEHFIKNKSLLYHLKSMLHFVLTWQPVVKNIFTPLSYIFENKQCIITPFMEKIIYPKLYRYYYNQGVKKFYKS